MRFLAQSLDQVFGTVTPPPQLKNLTDQGGAAGIGIFLGRIIQLIYIAAGIVFVFMIIFGAFQWITSGGEKEGLQKARGRILHAILGITLLALAFLIINIIGKILGFQFFNPLDPGLQWSGQGCSPGC